MEFGRNERAGIEASMASMVNNCRMCCMSVTRKRTVMHRGSHNPIVLFVGEAPGKYEDLKGLPFVGPSGRCLEAELSRAGISLDICGFVNAVKCRPTDPYEHAFVKNRPPTDEEVANCMPFLKQQIELMGPRIIVAVGKVAHRALHAYSPIYVLHPSAALRNPDDLMPILRRNLQAVKDTLDKLTA